MTKYKMLGLVRSFGDALALVNGKEWICVTTDFKNKYIKSKSKRKYNTNGGVLVFSWTNNKFLVIDPNTVSKIEPLSKLLNNATT